LPQLGRFDRPVQDASGNAVVGASVAIYREGATVNGAHSSASPATITVRHRGKIAAGDTVFIETTTGTTYSVNSVTATTVVLSGFAGTLTLSGGERITPSNSQPTLYSDDQGGATTANPLTTSATGRANCWMEFGAYDVIASGAGITATAYIGQVTVGEAPAVVYSGETDSATAVAHIEDTRFSLATAGAKLKSWRNLGTEKAAVDKDGTGIFPRIGPISASTTGGALRIIDGNLFPLTVAGVQAALDECEAIGGGTVVIPSAAGISITNTSVKIGNRVKLLGHGDHASTATFLAANTANVSAMVENKTQDGTQQYAYVEGISINGNKAGGAVITAGLKFVSVFSGSALRDTLDLSCSGNGILLAGNLVGLGPLLVDNVVSTGNNDHNILLKGTATQVYFVNITSEAQAAGKAALKIDIESAGAISSGHLIHGLHMEGTAAGCVGLLIDGASNVSVDNAAHTTGVSSWSAVVEIRNTLGLTGEQSPSGLSLRNIGVTAGGVLLVNDLANGVSVTQSPSSWLQSYMPPVSGNVALGQIVGVQYQRQGSDITAASTITPLEGNYFVVTGITNIDNITNSTAFKGRVIYLEFTGTPTLIHNSGGTGNLRLVGSANVAMTAGDVIQLVSNGTLWRQCAPVVVI